jgi:hypothetical protein
LAKPNFKFEKRQKELAKKKKKADKRQARLDRKTTQPEQTISPAPDEAEVL